MANRYRPSNINSIADKKIFFDANVLIYLFGYGTPTAANWENQYATLYSNLRNQNNHFVLLTNDLDFKDTTIDILSCHTRFFST